jgi:AcrR family transcriptional regulator
MKKNRAATEEKIYNAFLSLLKEKGPQGVGINAIAKKAAVSKELISRYFGGVKGLLLQYAQKGDFFKTMVDIDDQEGNPQQHLQQFIKDGTIELRENKLTQEILRWQLLENNEVTKDLFKYTNSQISKVFSVNHKNPSVNHAFQLMVGGYIYFTLLSKFNKTFIQTDLNNPETWENYDLAMEKMVDLFEDH